MLSDIKKYNKIFGKYYVIILILIFSASVTAMEHLPRSHIVIKDCKGNLFSVSKTTASECRYFKDIIFHTDNEKKPYDVSFKDSEHPFLNAATLHGLFRFIEGNAQCTEDIPTIHTIFDAAFWLGASQPVLRNLSLLVRKNVAQKDRKDVVRLGYCLNSIQSKFFADGSFSLRGIEHCLKKIDNGSYEGDAFCLNLAHKELDTLRGITDLALVLENVPIVKIKLNNNKLKKINVKKLIAPYFPMVQILKLRNSKIKKLRIKELPCNVFLDLENNRIKHMPQFFTHQKSELCLKNNRLTEQAKKNIDLAFPLSFDAMMHTISVSQEKRDKQFKCACKGSFVALFVAIYLSKQLCNESYSFVPCFFISWILSFSTIFTLVHQNPQWFLTAEEKVRRDDFTY